MELIGRLDSPYVRRTAITLALTGVDFTLRQVSVLKGFDEFVNINPVVKAPTLITAEGTVMMDSSLIIEYAASLSRTRVSLSPTDPAHFARAQRIVGLALAACEKSVQLVYEIKLRPAELQFQPWIERVASQLTAAYAELERELEGTDGWLFGESLTQADITTAVAWAFTQHIHPGRVSLEAHPALVRHSQGAEQLAEFQRYPMNV